MDGAQEIQMKARAVVVKDTSVRCDKFHTCVDSDIDPNTGRREYTAYLESDETLENLFRQQNRTAGEIIEACEWICRQLVKEGRSFLNYEVTPGHKRLIDLRDLSIDCMGWDEENFEVVETAD